MPEDKKEDIDVEFEEVEVEVETSKSDEFKEKAEKFREDFKTRAEARNEANKEKLDETLNKSKDVAGKVGENLSKTIDDTIIAMKALQKNFDSRYQGYKDTVSTGNISIDLAETKDFYYIKAAVPGVEKEDVLIEAGDNDITIETCFKPYIEEFEEEDEAEAIVSAIKSGKCEKTVRFENSIDITNITAKFANGIVTITIPKLIIPKHKVNVE